MKGSMKVGGQAESEDYAFKSLQMDGRELEQQLETGTRCYGVWD